MKPLLSKNPFFRFFAFLFYEIIAVPLLRLNDFFVLGLSIRGRENLRALKGRGAVLVCNHVHKLDCTMIGIAAAPRKVVYTAMAPLFRWKVIGPLIRILGAVPVPPSAAPAAEIGSFVRQTAEAAASGRLVCVYPEGELIPYCRELRDLKDGAFLIAARADVPVIPMVIRGRERRGIWKILKHRRPCLTLTAGTAIRPLPGQSPRRAAESLRLRARSAMLKMLDETGPGAGAASSAYAGAANHLVIPRPQ